MGYRASEIYKLEEPFATLQSCHMSRVCSDTEQCVIVGPPLTLPKQHSEGSFLAAFGICHVYWVA